jgi:hypothetical protein
MSRASQRLQAAGVVAAVVLAAVVNVLAARHFSRWDWTRGQRWSLSPATLETLHTLQQPVDVWAIAGPGDPFEQSLRQLLTTYGAHSSRIGVHWIDPDRDAVQLVDLQRRFGLEAGRTEDGRVATDAIVVVASGDKHWFLTASDMIDNADDLRVKPREERALTQAIRSVLGGERAKLCFTAGHGELALDEGRDEREAVGAIRDLLEKSNYELASVDTTILQAAGQEPYRGCAVVVIAGLGAPFAPAEAISLRTWLLEGGSLFAAVGPVPGSTDTGMTPAGLDDVLSPFGIALDDQLVHELEPSSTIPDTLGEQFFVEPRPHPVSAALVPGGADAHPPRVVASFARSLHHVSGAGAPWAGELLVTSENAFAKRNIVGASAWTDAPERAATDPRGPFVLAMASERPQAPSSAPGRAPHGPRVVVVGSRFALAEGNWRYPRPLHGMAFLVESAISWLSARPGVVDVPDKPEVSAGFRVSEAGLAEVRRYVLLFMPLAAALLGVAVWAWRRSSEDKPYEPPAQSSPNRREPS